MVIQPRAWWERGQEIQFGFQLQCSQDFDLEAQNTCMSGKLSTFHICVANVVRRAEFTDGEKQ